MLWPDLRVQPAGLGHGGMRLSTTSDSHAANWSLREERVSRDASKRLNCPVQFTRSIGLLSELNLPALLARYAQLFQLSNHKSRVLIEYIEMWSTLRRCCGSQLPKSWRMITHTRERVSPAMPTLQGWTLLRLYCCGRGRILSYVHQRQTKVKWTRCRGRGSRSGCS